MDFSAHMGQKMGPYGPGPMGRGLKGPEPMSQGLCARAHGWARAALRRIDEGEYGYCEMTGEPISLRRLDARPIATMTLEAQERHERREKVHRDD